MINSVGIKFQYDSNIYYINVDNFKFKKGITLIVSTDNGTEFVRIVTDEMKLKEESIDNSIHILRISSRKDYEKNLKNKKDSKEAINKIKKIVSDETSDMQIIDGFYNFDRSRLLIRFVSEQRVDFRKLAKKIASVYKTRIEFKQIGIRDKAREIGAIGICGKEVCCKQFIKKFDSISISMAKDQNIALNPSKINGVCGRLLCCLKFEYPFYKDTKNTFPKIGSTVEIKEGIGKVVSVNLFKKNYKVFIDGIGEVVVDVEI